MDVTKGRIYFLTDDGWEDITAYAAKVAPDPITRDWDTPQEDAAWEYLKKRTGPETGGMVAE